MKRAASVFKLTELKDVDEDLALLIRKVWKTPGTAEQIRALAPQAKAEETHRQMFNSPGGLFWRRWVIDALFGGSGVETLGQNRRTGDYIYYCNGGDLYAPTIIFHGDVLSVGCAADVVESNQIWSDRDDR